jgi:DNA-directed RNA polymerase subunit E'/Rpb7
MELTTLNKRVILHPKYLDSSIHTHLLNEIKKNVVTDCNKDYGYILDICNIVKVNRHMISQCTSDIIFYVTVTAQIIKPRKDMIVEGEIKLVFKEGIFVDVLNKFQVFVSLPDDYVYEEHNNVFKSKNNSLKIGDNVSIKINEVDYNDNQFIAFGSLL